MFKDMIKLSIGQFPPMSRAIVKVYYFQQLEFEDMSYCLRIPQAFIPKYIGDISKAIKALHPEVSDDFEMLEEEKDATLHEIKQMAHYANCLPWNLEII